MANSNSKQSSEWLLTKVIYVSKWQIKGGNASTRPFMDECFFVWRKVQCIKRELEIE